MASHLAWVINQIQSKQSHFTFAGGSSFAAGSCVAIAVGLTSTSGSRLVSGLDSALGSSLASGLASRKGGGGSALSAGMPLWGLAMRGGVCDLELLLQASRVANSRYTFCGTVTLCALGDIRAMSAALSSYPEELLLPELLEELLPELPDDELDELPAAGDLLEGAIDRPTVSDWAERCRKRSLLQATTRSITVSDIAGAKTCAKRSTTTAKAIVSMMLL